MLMTLLYFYTQPNLYHFEAKTNHELEKVSNWFEVNKLDLVNLSKTNYNYCIP